MITSARPQETAQRRAAAGGQSHEQQADWNASRIVEAAPGSKTAAIAASINARPEVNRLSSLQRAANSGPGAAHVAQMKTVLQGGSGEVAQMNGSDWFKRHIWGPHDYTVKHKAYTKGMGESDEEASEKVFEGMKKRPAPLSFGRESPEEGRTMWIPPFGQIFTQSNPSEKSLTNKTMPWKHLLHPGSVKRTAVGEDIETRGLGSGALPSMNEKFSNMLWGSVAYRTRLGLDPEFAKEHYEDIEKNMDKSFASNY